MNERSRAVDPNRARIHARVALGAILAVHIGLVAWGDWRQSPTWDEIGHLPAGLSHWYSGRFDLYHVNPPLVRMIATLPLLAASPGIAWPEAAVGAGSRQEFGVGHDFIATNGRKSFWYFAMARWACVPFSLVGAFVCFRWACDLFGDLAGLLAAALWCFSPNILANAQMITPDTGAAAMSAAAAYLFWRWLKQPDWSRALSAGVVMGLAELTKATLVVFFVLWPVLWLCRGLRNPEGSAPRAWRPEALQLAGILAISVYIINLGYGFDGSFESLGDLPFTSAVLTGETDFAGEEPAANRFSGTWLGSLPVPLPKNYVLGIDRQRREFEDKYWSYLRGEWRFGGWWYYYLYALAIKVPLGTWAMLALAILVSAVARGNSTAWYDEVFLLVPVAALLALVSSQTGFNHHLRYVLPIFPFAFIWMSKVARAVDLGHRGTACLASVALAWSVTSSLWVYPHNLSYFNEAVGGPMGGHAHLLDSNIDWGQDLLYLKRWLKEHPEAQPIALAYSLPAWLLDPKDVGMVYTLPPPGPEVEPSDWPVGSGETGPLPGWYAICVRRLRERDRQYEYFLRFKPVATAGYSIYIYNISVDDANRVRAELGLEPLPVPSVSTGHTRGGTEGEIPAGN
ncbi:MAG: glycosyltransferase family 39 protein [Thermoguttaceae bacterium]